MPDCRTDDGCRLEFTVEGPPEAPALLLVHALGTSRWLWDGVVPHLSRRLRVVRYDARGHGASDAPPGPYSLARLGQDALAVLDALAVARAHVCGLSIGGLTTLWLAVHAGSRVDRLVLANTAARIGTAALWEQRISAVEQGGLHAVADASESRWFSAAFRARAPETVRQWRQALLATPTAGYLGACAALRDADLRAEAAHVRAPTLVVAGTHDVSTPPSEAAWLAGAIARATLVELDAAHLGAVEAAEPFAAAVSAFLGG